MPAPDRPEPSQHARVSVRALMAIACLLLLAVVLVVSMQPPVAIRELTPFAYELEVPTRPPMPTEDVVKVESTGQTIGAIGSIIGFLVVAGLATLIGWVLYRLIRNVRWPKRVRSTPAVTIGQGVGQIADVEPQPDAETVREATVDARAQLATSDIPSDAILAAWVGFERAIGTAGLRRGAAETPAEFVVRVVGLKRDAAQPTVTLLRLYEDVRFGHVQATESDVVTAEGALAAIHAAWS